MQTATLTLANDTDYMTTATAISGAKTVARLKARRAKQCCHCNRSLSLFRALLFRARFCSAAHRRAYHEQIDTLMIKRLADSEVRIRRALEEEVRAIAA